MNTLHCPKRHVIAGDLDDSLVATRSHSEESRRASDEALYQIGALVTNLRLQNSEDVYFGSATGRTFDSIQQLAKDRPAFNDIFRQMDFHIASVGSAIHAGYTSNFKRVPHWPKVDSWDPTAIARLLSTDPDLTLQESAAQDTHKLSYKTQSIMETTKYTGQLSSDIAGLQADVIVSGGGTWRFVDVLPAGINKGSALLEMPQLLIEPPEEDIVRAEVCRIAVGDSMNDLAMLAVADVAIIPSNGQPDLLERVADNPLAGLTYIADMPFAAGVLQGLQRHFYGS